jgi:arabinose-5-phosphate isomerase
MTHSEELIYSTAVRTIRIEMEALLALSEALVATPDFAQCVEAIAASQGRVVVTGIGKSAIVAQKIVATLNSTGQPALFMHAADAIHGDIGMIQTNDLVICLSKSGDTPEIKLLVPLLKNFGNALIGVTANNHSFLAQHADYLLQTPIEKEADPNNLAPTASTTAQMALGDALAVTLLAKRGFTASDFARFHPGGTLGKQLYLRVSDLYPLHAKPLVHSGATLHEILLEISSKRLGATMVEDNNGKITGIITDGDLRRMLQRAATDYSNIVAADIQTVNPTSILPDAMAVEALDIMRSKSISQLPVLDTDLNYLGMIHLHDLIREGII